MTATTNFPQSGSPSLKVRVCLRLISLTGDVSNFSLVTAVYHNYNSLEADGVLITYLVDFAP